MNNLKALQKKLGKNNLLVSKTENIFYLTGFDGFSKQEREGFLIINGKTAYVFTDGRYLEAAGKSLTGFKTVEIKGIDSLTQELKKLGIKKLMTDEDNLTALEYKTIVSVAKLSSDKNVVEGLRQIKDSNEIEMIKKACRITDKAFKHILKVIEIGMTETEVAKIIEIFILSKKSSISFAPIVAFSENSSLPHHVPTNKKLKNNNIVLIDMGAKFENYCSDMTRTFFMGKANKYQKLIYQTVLDSQKKAIEHLKSLILNHKSIKASNIDKAARQYIVIKKYPSIPHSLGHGIGLEVHEKPRLSPKSDAILKEGMVFSIEPGIYIPKYGGVRIEDLYVLKSNGLERLTKSPRHLIEI